MFKKYNSFLLFHFPLIFISLFTAASAQIVDSNSVGKTQVILLGTGTPYPNPERSGPATAVVYNGRFFLFDAGAGVMRQINKAGLPISGPEAAFITHLHSDHTLGYSDVILTSWVMGRDKHLQVYGPHGLLRMTEYLLKAYSEDIEIRTEGLEKKDPDWYKVNAHEINPGIVYDSGGVKITAFLVLHGSWKEAYGYRIDTPDRSIVISGDTRPCQTLIDWSKGVDILIHEIHPTSIVKPEKRPGGEYWPEYQKQFHTSDIELGEIAKQSKPKLLILYHISRVNDKIKQELLENIRKSGFDGKIVVGNDMDIF